MRPLGCRGATVEDGIGSVFLSNGSEPDATDTQADAKIRADQLANEARSGRGCGIERAVNPPAYYFKTRRPQAASIKAKQRISTGNTLSKPPAVYVAAGIQAEAVASKELSILAAYYFKTRRP